MKKIILLSILISFSQLQISIAGDVNSYKNKIDLKLKEKRSKDLFTAEKNTGTFFSGLLLAGKKDNLYQRSIPQSSTPLKIKKQSKVSPVKMTILGVLAAGVFTGFHIYYANTWWKDQRDYFKYAADGYYARNMDKASHIYTANVFTVATSAAFEWAGVKPSNALLYGALTSMAYETYIEINDGFAPNWGFDWGDMGANVFGAVYPFLQEAAKPLKHVNFKWSFKPRWIKSKTSGTQDDLLDDYTNMTFWLSVNPMIALPETVTKAKLYPNFLALALGMSIKNASHVTGSTNAKVEWILSLDWDVNQLPGKSDFMKKLKKILNFYHFPAPAVKISPEGVWYGLYF